MKRQRQQALLELIGREALSSQHQITERLTRLGHDATQSTVSRDLEELGLIRVRDDLGRLRYAAPDARPSLVPVPRLHALLAEFATSIEASGNLVVVSTPPGTAGLVAEAIDREGVPGILGTVAGDNTILVVAREGVKGRTVAGRLRRLGGLP